jgi:hypothetical protein
VSNFLAVATVTAALKRALEHRLDADVPGARVTVSRPAALPPGQAKTAGVNVYLYQITPSAAFRSADLPTRRSDGTLLQRAQIGLDLHYLLSFYGEDANLEPQRVLGSVVNTLHAQPVITDAMIAAVKAAAEPAPPTQAIYPELKNTDLAEQPESIKFTPTALNLEELSKLWSVFFQTPYQLSVAYQASVVLIEEERDPLPVRPVLRRDILVEPLRRPVVDRVVAHPDPEAPIVATSTLSIEGRDLSGGSTVVRIAGDEAAPSSAGGSQVVVALSAFDAAVLRAGTLNVQVVQRVLFGDPPIPHGGVESAPGSFVLHPKVQAASVVGTAPARRVRVTVDLTIGAAQNVALLLLDENTAEQRFLFASPERTADATVLEVPVAGVAPGKYLVQLLVDGAESILETDADGDYVAPKVTHP